MDKTGMVMGRVSPIIYFEDAGGNIMLAPDTETANHFWRNHRDRLGRTLFDKGYDLREAGTWKDVQTLQDRLVAQEEESKRRLLENHQEVREDFRRRVASDLYAKLISSGTTEYEKEFIRAWLSLRDETKRDRYREALEQRAQYLWAVEMDSGHDSNITDRIKI